MRMNSSTYREVDLFPNVSYVNTCGVCWKWECPMPHKSKNTLKETLDNGNQQQHIPLIRAYAPSPQAESTARVDAEERARKAEDLLSLADAAREAAEAVAEHEKQLRVDAEARYRTQLEQFHELTVGTWTTAFF